MHREMRSESRIAQEEAARFVTGRFRGASRVVPLRQGLWSSAFAFQRGDERLVIRFGSIRGDFEKDAFVGKRAPHDLPVPRVLELAKRWAAGTQIARHLPGVTSTSWTRTRSGEHCRRCFACSNESAGST
jgi:hypothetical protein